MIKHIVLWNVRGATLEERRTNLALLQREFEGLRGCIPGLLHLEIGIDESGVDYACHVALYTEFASREALAAYAEHPEHLRVRRTLGDMRIERHQVDYEAFPHEAARARRDPPTPAGATAGPVPGDEDHVQAL